MKYLFILPFTFFLFSNMAIANNTEILYAEMPILQSKDLNNNLIDQSYLPTETILFNSSTRLTQETCRVKMKGSFNGLEFDFWVEINMSCKDFWGQFLDTFFDKM